MTKITLSAYAKLNLSLFIVGVREDGYHELESIMQKISLADTLEMEAIPEGIVISCNKKSIPTGEKNLCWKAARRYLDEAGLSGGVKIRLFKRIPDGAGMGGGSADAAAVLKGMQALYPSEADLYSIAAKIGADVPFCLKGGTCLCEGIGERLTPVSFKGKEKIFAVVAKNCEGLSTPHIYKLFDAINQKEKKSTTTASLMEAMRQGALQEIPPLLCNDLELPAISEKPEIGAMKMRLLDMGAECAMMTGSGSAVFALYFDEAKARESAEILSSEGIEAAFCKLL